MKKIKLPTQFKLNNRYFLCFSFGFLLSLTVHAAQPTWSQNPVPITVQEKPLKEFLQDLFSFAGITVVFSNQVQGSVSGQFSQTADKTFNDIVRAYGLLPYYDGNVMHISTVSEVQSKSIKTDPDLVDKVLTQIIKLDLTDSRQSIQVIKKSGLIKARGSAQFVLDIEELVQTINQSYKKPAIDAVLVGSKSQPNKYGDSGGLIFHTFELKYASAEDVTYYQNDKEIIIPGVATLLRNMMGENRTTTQRTTAVFQPWANTLQGLRGHGLNQAQIANHRYQQELVNAGFSQPQANNPDAYADYSGFGTASLVNRNNIIRIEADRNLNAVIVRDYADAMPLYSDLIQQLDKEPQLVEIQVTIIDVDKDKLLDLGLDWRYQGSRTSARLGGGDNLDADGSAGGLLLNTVLGDAGRFVASIRALAETGSAQIVSKPQVLTLSNLEAVLRSDESFFIRVAGNEEVDLFNVSVGTTLRVVPQVVGDSFNPQIRLAVTIEDGSIVPEASVDDIPVIENSSLNTQAIIYNGEDLLLGGLVKETSRKNVSKVPLLGDVPGLGNLFKRTVTTDTRTERLFLISPRIVSSHRNRNQTAQSRSTERMLLSSISPEYNNQAYYNSDDKYVRQANSIYKTAETKSAKKPKVHSKVDYDKKR